MEKVKSAFEKAMEKIQGIEALTPEEKEELKERERIRSVLAAFYKGQIKRDEMWEKLKGANPALLKEAQFTMVGSLRLMNTPEEFDQRRDGIVAFETIRAARNIPAVEHVLTEIDRLRKEYLEVKEKAVKQLRAAVEQNPQLRVRPVKAPDGRTVLQASMTVDEAVRERLSDFLAEQEKRYDAMFAKSVERLKKELE